MAKAKPASVEVVALDEEAQKDFDDFVKHSKIASKGRRSTDLSRDLRDKLVAQMGNAMVAELPDGRRIQRVHQERWYGPKKGALIEWDDLNLIPIAK